MGFAAWVETNRLFTYKMDSSPIRVLYSFPHKIGSGRICWTAWQQVVGLVDAGATVVAIVGSMAKPLPAGVTVKKTLGIGPFRIPYRLLGVRRASLLHDWMTASWLKRHVSEVDIVHAWPLGGLRTIRVAKRLGIPVVMERPNAHTAFAYQVVEDECKRIDLTLPDGFEHKYDGVSLAHEVLEYDECDYLLCPSDFVAQTFLDKGFRPEKLLKHQYGYDESLIQSGDQEAHPSQGLVAIYVGLCTPRKGLHYALEAWLSSEACKTGKLMVCGEFVPGYKEKFEHLLSHPSVEVLGHRKDIPELMKQADIFILSTIEEGSALVTYEARGAGCVLLVSDASGAVCETMQNGLVHRARDVETLRSHLDLLNQDRGFLGELRTNSLSAASQLTWRAAGVKLLDVYRLAINGRSASNPKR
jgi:glycosyltransferase involved in cell wall biosynthesis